MSEQRQCGYIGIVGRPNVGKSTLLNHILQQKLAITSRKPQTTRHRILGVKTQQAVQAIYVDTPGLHRINQRALNRYMNRMARFVIKDVDVLIFVADALKWHDEEAWMLEQLREVSCPLIVALNKVDKIQDKGQLLPLIESINQKLPCKAIVPLSAKHGWSVEVLEREVERHLPQADFFYFPEDQVTDRSNHFLAAELVREKLMRAMGQELPYETTVEVQAFGRKRGVLDVVAVIWVERESQKAIVIGRGGQRLKDVGRQARLDMQRLFKNRVFLRLWVKVRNGWSDNERILSQLGYCE